MLFWIFGLTCLARLCTGDFIDGMNCSQKCVCCNGGVAKCKDWPRVADSHCVDGCVDGIYGYRCHNSCPENCNTCDQVWGRPCTKCKATFYDKDSECSKKCSIGCVGGACNDDGTCSTCAVDFEGTKCEPCIQGKYGSNCTLYCTYRNCRCSTGTDCTYCKKGFYGRSTFCQTPCSQECQDGVCNDDGSCNFRNGFSGKSCTECQSLVRAIAGGVCGGIVFIIGIVVALLHFRRRSICTSASNQTKLNGKATFQVYTTDERETKREKPSFDNERHFKRCKSLPILNTTGSWTPANKPTSVMQHVSAYAETVHENKIDLEIDEEGNETLDESSKDGPADYNEPESTTYQPKIPSDQLVEYLDEKSHDGLSSEFGTFTCGLVKPYVESQKTENIYKNRYKGIYPYDDSRVKVSGRSDYINASFIDGYNKPQQYIATLGPTSKQLGDFSLFWKMIWQQRVEKVVMVTNLTEQGYPKCEQYWPNPGTTKTFGAIEVKSSSEDEYAEFTRRAFTVTMGIEERTVHHLHFTCWPVRAIPDDVTAMIEFRQRVLITPSTLNGPTVVHCSAGVGRTGIYIALDILTEEGEVERAIDIAGCVHKMRQNRPNMVQTLKQYQFLHKAAVYSLTFDCKQIKGENFKQYMNNHSTKELNNQFIRLQHSVEIRSNKETRAVERNKRLLNKNRQNADIPGNENRPRLYLNLKPGATDYINAVYIHSFIMKKRYLVAQTPLPETVIDFLTLVVQEGCSCIVSFEANIDKQKTIGTYYPPAKQDVLKKGTFQVSCSRVEEKTFYTESTLTIQHKGSGMRTGRTIQHLQFTDWDEMKNIPRSTGNFLFFLNVVESFTKKQDYGPILIHCFDGASKSGLFCVVSLLLQKMAVEHEISVLNAVRKVKSMRRLAIPNQEQFVYCHKCVSDYLCSFDGYANFKFKE